MEDLRLIRHFEAVFRLNSFSKAADELRLTHSALTKSIKTLEENWDVQLFHRTTRTIVPTEAGKRLHPMAIDLLAFAKNVRTQTQEGDHLLNIVCGPAVLDAFIHPAIAALRTSYPLARVSAETMPPLHAVEELVQRRIHLLLYHSQTLAGLPHLKRLKIQELVDEPYVVLFRSDHPVQASAMDLSDLLKYDWAIAGYDTVFQTNMNPAIKEQLLAADFPRYRLLSQSACIELSAHSDIITTVPQSVAEPLVASGRFRSVLHPAEIRFRVSAATLIDSGFEPLVASFVDALRNSHLEAG